MIKTNYYAEIYNSNNKKIAERRVYKTEYSNSTYNTDNKEYIYFEKCLYNVDDLLDKGYRIMYRFVPHRFGSFAILDFALAEPFERKRRA